MLINTCLRRAVLSVALSAALPAAAQSAAQPTPSFNAASCIVRPSRDAEVATALPGIINRVAVTVGQRVARGEVLIELERGLAEASLQLALAREQFAQRALARNQQLIAEGLLADSEVDRLNSEYRVALLERQKIEAEIDYLIVTAPFAGVVAERLIEAGEWSGERAALRLIDTDQLLLSITAKRDSYDLLAPGVSITMAVQGEAEPVVATVTERAPMVEAASASFVVNASFDNRQRGIVPGVACRSL